MQLAPVVVVELAPVVVVELAPEAGRASVGRRDIVGEDGEVGEVGPRHARTRASAAEAVHANAGGVGLAVGLDRPGVVGKKGVALWVLGQAGAVLAVALEGGASRLAATGGLVKVVDLVNGHVHELPAALGVGGGLAVGKDCQAGHG